MQSYFHVQADWHAVARDVMPCCHLWEQELELQGKIKHHHVCSLHEAAQVSEVL